MLGVKYTGPYRDFSGYAEAARNYILAIRDAGIPITINVRRFDVDPPKTSMGDQEHIFSELEQKDEKYDVNIVHLTPDLWPQHVERGKYNIGIFAWETGKLPPLWVSSCNTVDEVWVPSDYNIQALKDSGVKAPVYKIRHGIDPHTYDGVGKLDLDLTEVDTVFYSIFQWIYRKNPEGLLMSYFNAFSPQDKVVLILKTYLSGGPEDVTSLRKLIAGLKKDMQLSYYPRVLLIPHKMTREQILELHTTCDCYVSLHRGEGFGLPLLEAGLAGNSVITTGYSGNLEFTHPDNSYLVSAQPTYVSHMSTFNPWYHGNQVWAEPNLVEASNMFRRVHENKDERNERGRMLQELITNEFSWEAIATSVVNRLSSI